jgi:signal transduction histidine kinase
MYGKKKALGTLGIFGEAPRLFNVEDLGLLDAVAEQLGIAIDDARLHERAEAAIVLEERQRLARDLHDSVTQLLYSQTLFAAAATKALRTRQRERAESCLTQLGEAAGQALREMRLLIYRLRPPVLARVGLVGALRRRLEMVEQRAGVITHLTGEIPQDLPSELERALYHIAEEGLNNVLKHARATEVWIDLEGEHQTLTLSIVDNGCGFDVTGITPGLGLQSLKERTEALNGSLSIESEPGHGTQIIARVPWEHPIT